MTKVMQGIFILMILLQNFAMGERITVVGIGRLGLCAALCLERAGYEVLGVDVSSSYVDMINAKTFQSNEPLVNEYLSHSMNFRASTSLKEGLDFSDTLFVAISTTTGTEGYDFAAMDSLLESIRAWSPGNKHLVICSTVVPGYIQKRAQEILKDLQGITISYNAPFIAQGNIIAGYCNPDIVLIGQGSREAGDQLEGLYRRVCENAPYFARMTPASAEITKLAINSYVTFKIAYANLIGDIAEKTMGADKNEILEAVGSDRRIGRKNLQAGYGYGGPCFPRDNRLIAEYAYQIGLHPLLFSSIDLENKQHAQCIADRFIAQNLPLYIFEDVSYKPNCPVKILQESQKLEVAKKVAEEGKCVCIRDVESVILELKEKYGDLFQYEIRE